MATRRGHATEGVPYRVSPKARSVVSAASQRFPCLAQGPFVQGFLLMFLVDPRARQQMGPGEYLGPRTVGPTSVPGAGRVALRLSSRGMTTFPHRRLGQLPDAHRPGLADGD